MNLDHPNIEKAFDWLERADGTGLLSSSEHCETRDIFQARLDRMKNEMIKKGFTQDYSLVIAVTGELGNNAFDHNLGKWRDEPGVYFAYSRTAGNSISNPAMAGSKSRRRSNAALI